VKFTVFDISQLVYMIEEDCGTAELNASDLEMIFPPWLDNATTHVTLQFNKRHSVPRFI